jgi:hypothetical protein
MELSGRFLNPPPLLNQGGSVCFVGALRTGEDFTWRVRTVYEEETSSFHFCELCNCIGVSVLDLGLGDAEWS